MTSLENAITGNVIVYQAENESVSTNVLFKDETFWMTQKDISKLFDVNPQAISKHLNNIYSDGELDIGCPPAQCRGGSPRGRRREWVRSSAFAASLYNARSRRRAAG